MKVHVEAVPYSFTVLHALKYPHCNVYGVLLGKKDGDKLKITGAVPITHENTPLAPSLTVALSLVNAKASNIVGVYFSEASYKHAELNAAATRLAEKISSISGIPATILHLVNWNLSSDCSTNCLTALVKQDDIWKEVKTEFADSSTKVTSRAIQNLLQRSIVDFDNHLENPELDFFNGDLAATLAA